MPVGSVCDSVECLVFCCSSSWTSFLSGHLLTMELLLFCTLCMMNEFASGILVWRVRNGGLTVDFFFTKYGVMTL
jgi:hypothetical protein